MSGIENIQGLISELTAKITHLEGLIQDQPGQEGNADIILMDKMVSTENQNADYEMASNQSSTLEKDASTGEWRMYRAIYNDNLTPTSSDYAWWKDATSKVLKQVQIAEVTVVTDVQWDDPYLQYKNRQVYALDAGGESAWLNQLEAEELTVITAIEWNSPYIQYKTNTVKVFAKGTESALTELLEAEECP